MTENSFNISQDEPRPEVTDAQLMELCSEIPLERMQQIAVRYLGFDLPDIQIVRENFPGDDAMVKCSLLENWRNRNYINTKERLLDILMRSAHDGLLHPKTFAFLDKERSEALMKGKSKVGCINLAARQFKSLLKTISI